LPDGLGLIETVAALRRGKGLAAGQKALIVLDQFEQWLHARKGEAHPDLVSALRQCDGGRVQCIVLVRDDFWMAVTRFLTALEVDLLHGHNVAAVDLFDLRHANKVLSAFGRAFGTLSESATGRGLTAEHREFLDQAVSGLAQDNKVICVRLALFAEMMKGREWTPATLKEVGGTEGVGVTFLEEAFCSPTANPKHRLHQQAVRGVLKALLPEAGTDIKGHMRSQVELREACGYAHRPRDFEGLLHILDTEVRLITPTDPEGVEPATGGRQPPDAAHQPNSLNPGADAPQLPTNEKYYQLTHDYLVPSLRDWLTRKQKETRRGRAELLLADRAAVWNARPENRQLPSLWQWLQIRWLTAKKTWTQPQRTLMGRASRYHGVRALVVAVCLAVLAGGGYEGRGRLQAHALRGRLLDADTKEVPAIVRDMAPYRHWLDPLLQEASAQAEASRDNHKRLHAGLALLPVDATQVDYLYSRLLAAAPEEVPVIRDALAPYKDQLLERLWGVVEKPDKDQESQRLPAAAALATYDPASQHWDRVGASVVNDLVRVPSVYLATWLACFRPVEARLLAPLGDVFRDSNRRETERSLATDIVAAYAADEPNVLADLLMDANEKQFAVLFPRLKRRGEHAMPLLSGEIDKKLPADLPSSDERREKLAKRQVNAAVALLRMGQVAKVWPLLKRGDQPEDPRVRNYLIHRFGPLGVDAGALVQRLAEEPDVTIRRALILSLGPEEFGTGALDREKKKHLVQQLQELYRTAADPGLHAAAEWLLRQWKEEAWLAQTEEAWAKDKEQREKRLEAIKKVLASEGHQPPGRQWYVNGQGQTMVVVPGPVEFFMGSPPTEEGRKPDEVLHKRRIGRTIAVAAKPVTKEQFLRFLPNFSHNEMGRYPEAGCPIGGVIWHEAAAYCNWLSQEEGIPPEQWCYERNVSGQVTNLKEGYLSLTGYRLPTEAEIEYVTRAGAVTSHCYGEAEDLLGKYAWYIANSMGRTWPAGSKKPNDWGVFDIHGNVWSWCQERYKEYPQGRDQEAIEDKEDVLSINSQESRVLRGGSFVYRAWQVRSAIRNSHVPANRWSYVGFRAARTLAP
jgi:formylglycine-generating enzyme required for sulfatase activity